MNYKESIDYIHSLLAFGIKPGLERISELLELLGNPQDKIKTVHIAGTNGKGSTSTMLSNMLIADGHKTGLFTSPYVLSFCERIQINGENIDENILAAAVTSVREKIEELSKKGIVITEFEAITAAAFLIFFETCCEYAVIEVGLGGRFDATNVIKNPEAVVITSISLDHTKILGDTIEQIAFEKCGIIKKNSVVITSQNQTDEALKVIEKTAKEKLIITKPQRAELIEDTLKLKTFAYGGEAYETALSGEHQTENAVNAIETAKYLGISRKAIKDGVSKTRMTARMEIISENPLIIRDGGHNEGCSEALRKFILNYDIKNIKMLIGMMADKDTETYVKNIAPLCKEVVAVTPSNPRAMSAEELAEIASKYCESTKFIEGPKEGYDYIVSNAEADDTILVCGSFYLMSDIF